MIEFVKINLLPYREEIKQRKKQQFKVLMLSALLIGAGLLVLTYLTINNAISRQEDRKVVGQARLVDGVKVQITDNKGAKDSVKTK